MGGLLRAIADGNAVTRFSRGKDKAGLADAHKMAHSIANSGRHMVLAIVRTSIGTEAKFGVLTTFGFLRGGFT